MRVRLPPTAYFVSSTPARVEVSSEAERKQMSNYLGTVINTVFSQTYERLNCLPKADDGALSVLNGFQGEV